MGEIKIPKLYRSKIIEIEGNEIEIRGHRPIDIPLVLKIQRQQEALIPLLNSAKIFQKIRKKMVLRAKKSDESDPEQIFLDELDKIDETKLSEKEIAEMENALKEVEKLRSEIDPLTYTLAQRGLKRYYYPDIKNTEKIDEINDIDIDIDNAREIVSTMIELSNPPKKITKNVEEDKKKALKKK